jgi:hypothetical protein
MGRNDDQDVTGHYIHDNSRPCCDVRVDDEMIRFPGTSDP